MRRKCLDLAAVARCPAIFCWLYWLSVPPPHFPPSPFSSIPYYSAVSGNPADTIWEVPGINERHVELQVRSESALRTVALVLWMSCNPFLPPHPLLPNSILILFVSPTWQTTENGGTVSFSGITMRGGRSETGGACVSVDDDMWEAVTFECMVVEDCDAVATADGDMRVRFFSS